MADRSNMNRNMQQKQGRMARIGVLCGVAMLTALFLTPATAQYYIYKGPDGQQLFTDKKLKNLQGFTLLATVGRPTAAKKSCAGPNSSVMANRVRPYKTAIDEYSEKYNVDPALVKAIIIAESCFNRKAVSRVGARGLMQLMPGTAQQLGVSDSFDARQNIRGGVNYYRWMLDRFNNNTRLALAAYNAGPVAVETYKGIPPYKETQGYVKKVLRLYGKMGGQLKPENTQAHAFAVAPTKKKIRKKKKKKKAGKAEIYWEKDAPAASAAE